MRVRIGSAVAVAALATAASARARQAAPSGVVQERASAVVIEIPVNVFGKDGRALAGLEAKDFELYDDGRKQALNAVEVVDLSKPPEPAAPGAAGALPQDVPASARRLWLLVFDTSYTSMSSLLRARDGARNFVTASMPPSDLAAVGTLSVDTGWRLLVNFTRDRAQLAAAIDSLGLPGLAVRTADPLAFAFNAPGGYGASNGTQSRVAPLRGSDMEEGMHDVQSLQRQSSDEQERGRVTKLMNGLAGMGRVLDSVRGRKHVLFFSEGFDTRLLAGRAASTTRVLEHGIDTTGADPGTTLGANEAAITGQIWKVDSDARFGSSSLRDQFSTSLGFFPRSDAVLDAIDIGGVRAEADASGPKPASGTDALSTMASETGGDFVRNANALGGELKAVSDRTSLVYLLVYQPRGLSRPGSFHKLRVEVKAPGAKVTARSGYYEPRPYASLSPLEKMLASGDLVTGGVRGESVSGRLVVAPFASPADVAQVPLVLELPGAELFAGDKAGKAGVQVYAYAADAAGTLADYVVSEATLDLSRVRATLEAGGLKFYATLYLGPGAYRIHVLAREAATGRAGVFSADMEVPAIPGGAATVLPPFFPEPPGRWVMMRANPRADAPARAADYPFAVSGEPFIPAALPEVSGGAATSVAVFTYNFGGGTKPGALAVTGQVVGADGQARPAALTVVKESDVERGGGRKVMLSFKPEGLTPGRYTLKVAVADPATKAAGEAASAFEVK